MLAYFKGERVQSLLPLQLAPLKWLKKVRWLLQNVTACSISGRS